MFSTSIRGAMARERSSVRARRRSSADRRGTIVLRHHRFLSMHRETRLYARNMLNRVRGNSDHVSSPCKWLERLMTIPCHGRKSTGHRFFFPPLCHSAPPPRFLTLPSLPPPLSRASSSFGVPAILSRYELARAFGCKVSRITLPKESPPTVLHR